MKLFNSSVGVMALILTGMLFWSQPGLARLKAIEAQPLARVLSGQKVGAVRSGPIQVPLITWGGDIATILANGDSEQTRRGSLFSDEGLSLNLVREDNFSDQLRAYMSGQSPYLRGTLGMINMAAELLAADPRTNPVVIYQLTWSAGGDALVVKPGIQSARDLRGKTIALQAYGPHVDYMTKILADAGLRPKDVQLRWLPDLTGSDNAPMAALAEPDVDAAFVIIPDALVLSSGGAVGTGAEGSVKGARILLSTKTANRIIADAYAVRSDYFKDRRDEVEKFVHGLLKGEEALRELVRDRKSRAREYERTMKAAAKLLLDSELAVPDAEGLYADAEFAGHAGNVQFLDNPTYPRRMEALVKETQSPFQELGLISKRTNLDKAGWNYNRLRQGLSQGDAGTTQRFDESQVAAVVSRRQQQGTLAEGELFSFEIFFQPNQNEFSPDLYRDDFRRVVELASTYGGAIITVEGHSDPMAYLRGKKDGKPEVVLGRIKQSARNLSLSRAIAVRDNVIALASRDSISLDTSQFAVVGHGIAKPKNGVCGSDPCAPRNEREWRNNMRVEFRIIQVEAESSVFKPL